MTAGESDTLYEFVLHDQAGTFLSRTPCVPPFHQAPWVAIAGDRYFVLMDDMTYHEAERVHWLPSTLEVPRADPVPE